MRWWSPHRQVSKSPSCSLPTQAPVRPQLFGLMACRFQAIPISKTYPAVIQPGNGKRVVNGIHIRRNKEIASGFYLPQDAKSWSWFPSGFKGLIKRNCDTTPTKKRNSESQILGSWSKKRLHATVIYSIPKVYLGTTISCRPQYQPRCLFPDLPHDKPWNGSENGVTPQQC